MDKHRGIIRDIVKYKGIIFDLDGTLVNLNTDWEELKRTLSEFTMKEKGEKIEFTPLDQKIHQTREKFGEAFFGQLLDIISQFELCEEKYEFNHELISFLESCREKKISIYSMNTRKCVMNFVEKYLKRKPDIIIAKDDCIEPKPTGKDLKKILEEWGLNTKEVVYIGNSESDRISGEMADIRTYIIKNLSLADRLTF